MTIAYRTKTTAKKRREETKKETKKTVYMNVTAFSTLTE